LKILFTLDAHYIPQVSGGVESNTHELALDLIKHGHEASVMCRLSHEGLTGFKTRALMKLFKNSFVAQTSLGYPLYRQWSVPESVPQSVRELRPDVVIIQKGDLVPLARMFKQQGVPTLIYLHSMEFQDLNGDPRSLDDVGYIANSRYTARRYQELYGIESTVIPPYFHAERYRVERRGKNVTFINPHPKKGRDLAFEIAKRCPEIPFTFVISWSLPREMRKALDEKLKTTPNVTLRPQTANMKSIYARAKILLVPSMWEEAWGRVVTEAQFSGIPVVGSNRAGLPESVGPGGVLLDPEGPLEPWVEAVRRLWSDEAHYQELSKAALEYSKRPEIDPAVEIDALLEAAKDAVTKQSGREQSKASAKAG